MCGRLENPRARWTSLSKVVSISKAGGDYCGIDLLEMRWKVIEGVLDGWLKRQHSTILLMASGKKEGAVWASETPSRYCKPADFSRNVPPAVSKSHKTVGLARLSV